MKTIAILLLLCGCCWGQGSASYASLSSKAFSDAMTISFHANAMEIRNWSGDMIVSCILNVDSLKESVSTKDCKLGSGKTLNDAMRGLATVYYWQSTCYTREGKAVHYGLSGDLEKSAAAVKDCMYNGATFRDWDRYHDVLDSSVKFCDNHRNGTAPYFDPILRKTYRWDCKTILAVK